MRKYYIEMYLRPDCEYTINLPYVAQSKWFNTKEEAINFAHNFDYIDDNFGVALMSSEWDEEYDTYTDIIHEKDMK